MSPTRSGLGSRAAAAANGSAGGGAQVASPSSEPAIRSSSAADSATVRVSTPSATRNESPSVGASDTRPRAGFRPTSPQQAAGMRIEPPPSLPCASGTIPAATAAAGAAGGAAGRAREVPRVARRADCGATRSTAGSRTPAARSCRRSRSRRRAGGRRTPRRTARRSRRTGRAQKVSGIPSTGWLSLIAIGTPANGRSSPGPIASAAASARSPSTCVKALSCPSSVSIRSSEADTSSRALISPERTSAASSLAGRKRRSCTVAPCRGADPGLAAWPILVCQPGAWTITPQHPDSGATT